MEVPILIIKCIEKIDGKSKNYKNSDVKSIYKLIAPSYTSPTIFKDSKTISNLIIFFIITLSIIIIIVFQIIKIDLLTNIIYSIGAFVKRFSGYISEYSLFRLSRW